MLQPETAVYRRNICVLQILQLTTRFSTVLQAREPKSKCCTADWLPLGHCTYTPARNQTVWPQNVITMWLKALFIKWNLIWSQALAGIIAFIPVSMWFNWKWIEKSVLQAWSSRPCFGIGIWIWNCCFHAFVSIREKQIYGEHNSSFCNTAEWIWLFQEQLLLPLCREMRPETQQANFQQAGVGIREERLVVMGENTNWKKRKFGIGSRTGTSCSIPKNNTKWKSFKLGKFQIKQAHHRSVCVFQGLGNSEYPYLNWAGTTCIWMFRVWVISKPGLIQRKLPKPLPAPQKTAKLKIVLRNDKKFYRFRSAKWPKTQRHTSTPPPWVPKHEVRVES